MKKLLFAMPNGRFDQIFPESTVNEIRKRFTIIGAAPPASIDESYIANHADDVDVIITSWGTPLLGVTSLAKAPKVELIAHAAGSVKPIVSDYVWEKGIRVSSAAQATPSAGLSVRGCAGRCGPADLESR